MVYRRPLGIGRELLGPILALGFGLTIGLIDSRPEWDDTGITAGLLVAAAAVAALGAFCGFVAARSLQRTAPAE